MDGLFLLLLVQSILLTDSSLRHMASWPLCLFRYNLSKDDSVQEILCAKSVSERTWYLHSFPGSCLFHGPTSCTLLCLVSDRYNNLLIHPWQLGASSRIDSLHLCWSLDTIFEWKLTRQSCWIALGISRIRLLHHHHGCNDLYHLLCLHNSERGSWKIREGVRWSKS